MNTRRICFAIFLLLSVLAMIAAFGVAMSRCVLGVHFPIDVVAGALLGSTFGALGARWHLRRSGALSS